MADKATLKTRVDTVLEDPGAMAVARMYADALLNSLPREQVEPVLAEFAAFVQDVYLKHPEFAQMLASAMIKRDDKKAILERVLQDRVSPVFGNFLRVLAKHERMELIPKVLKQLQLLREETGGQVRVEVTSAIPINEATAQSIRESLATKFKFDPILKLSVDPALLGGLRIRVGDTIYDTSLRTRLRQLHERLRERSIHEIQSGRNRFSHPERD